MKLFVIARRVATRRSIWIASLALAMTCSACAHKAPLKSPTEIVKDQAKKEKAAASRAKRDAKKLKNQSPEKPPQESQEVVVPEAGK